MNIYDVATEQSRNILKLAFYRYDQIILLPDDAYFRSNLVNCTYK